jgi:hypothetical protein
MRKKSENLSNIIKPRHLGHSIWPSIPSLLEPPRSIHSRRIGTLPLVILDVGRSWHRQFPKQLLSHDDDLSKISMLRDFAKPVRLTASYRCIQKTSLT